ncbi:M23 family metallopeptidase [Bacillus pinisoli]|uniref:M23 family metallopeptidase n=1 Tax=Bacillus pinisoli TaxID=2901866 RepID=UPI001FF1DD9C|nr:M23 family metallopeptidase [Bacillus pinisoli]
MKKWIILFTALIIITGCAKNEVKEKELVAKELVEKSDPLLSLPVTIQDKQSLLSIDELFNKLDIPYQYDVLNRVLNFNVNETYFRLVYGVPVYEKDHEYVPTNRDNLVVVDDIPHISLDFLTEDLKWEVRENKTTIEILLPKSSNEILATANAAPSKTLDADEIINLLSVLKSPINGAKVSMVSSHLPGAPRNYRNGTHEGLDFYQYGTNVEINQNTPVYGMGEGKVIRVDHDYPGYSSVEERNKDLSIAAESVATPEYILDKLRGKQVWIYYSNGILARFAHLDRVAKDLAVGDMVTKNTVIGFVGNSGTSGEVLNNNTEFHLHLDLLIHNELFWKGLDKDEVIKVLTTVFEKRRSS